MTRIIKWSLYITGWLLIFEISVRVLLATPAFANHRKFRDELSWRRWWVHVHQSGQTMLYGFDAYDATKGWLPKPNLRNLRAFGDATLSTSAKGLRGTEEHAGGKRLRTPRILLLGDSFTFGDEVSDTETYAAELQRLLPHTEVINMGVHGYGHDQMLILFREEGVRYAPDIVILGFVADDMPRNLLRFRDYAKPRFTVDHGVLRLVGSPVPPPDEILRWDWARPRLVDISSIIADELKRATGRLRREQDIVTRLILSDLVKEAHEIPARVVILYLPALTEITSPAPLTDGERFLFDFCGEVRDVRCFSVRPAFAEAIARGVTIPTTRHWNAAGHRVAARAIRRYLTSAGVVLPNSP